MKIIADTHTHTIMSGHAHSTLLENIRAAKSRDLSFLCVTDHTGIMPCAPDNTYFSCMRATLPDIYEGVYLLRGCEANILDETGRLDVPEGVLQKLEWVIASIHGILTKPMDEIRHTQLWCRIAENPHVDVIGHCGEEAFRFDYEEGIRAFAAHKKIVEINAYSFRSRPTSRKNCMEIARLCQKHGVPLVISSDAHFAGGVGDVQTAIDHLQEAGIEERSILNVNTNRFAQYVSAMTGRTFNV
ncbi:MAG: PHP domain-containing protein [Ruminococcaceae bacterium]|nr:PHP domain-containing protein [Oscillospiraceae bacterium]